MPEQSINRGTIPADIVTTGQRPDIVMINKAEKKITLFELTVSFEKNIESANLRKSLRYNDLASDIKKRGWSVENTPFEIGSRRHITKRNLKLIPDTLKIFKIKPLKKKAFDDISKISLLCSFSIFQAHCQPAWQSPPFLQP